MAKFHVNMKTGDAGSCRALKGKCPFGGEENHYSNKKSALKAYEEKLSSVSPPKLDGSLIRFQELTSPLELQKLAYQLESRFKYKPTTKLKIADRNGFGIGVTNISYDPYTQEYAVGRSRMRINQVFKRTKTLVEALSYAAETEGYSDEQYDPLDWDE